MTQGTTRWLADGRTDTTETWTEFARSSVGELAIGNPGAGLWNVTGETTFDGANQTPFYSGMDTPKERDVARITAVYWEKEIGTGGGLLFNRSTGSDFYPDATVPGDAANNRVNVIVEITPGIEGVPIYLDWYDVDDPSDHDGPIDDETGGSGDINVSDNFLTGTGPAVAFASSAVTDVAGEIRETFQVGWIQPGNNFRVAASPRQEELAPSKPLRADAEGRLFYDENGDTLWNVGEPPLMDSSSSVHGVGVTPALTVWRILRVEVDSMGKVFGNATAVNVTAVTTAGGQSTLKLEAALPPEDNNRYEQGQFVDSNGNQWVVDSNTTTTITVNTRDQDGDGVHDIPALGPGTLTDDDKLKNGLDVPRPDTDGLGAALREAYISVQFDIGDNNDAVPFALNTSSTDVADPHYYTKLLDWDSRYSNSVPYWVAYVLGGYQPDVELDNDPDGELPLKLGQCSDNGAGCIVYLETNRDIAKSMGWDEVRYEQDTVVHEIGHAVSGVNEEPVTVFDLDFQTYNRYTEVYRKHIRSSEKPLS